jgi:hypothetical protein
MGWKRKAAAIIAAASTALIWTGMAEAQSGNSCKAACNTTYQACGKRAINGETCLRRWHACKKKCSPAVKPMSPAPAATKAVPPTAPKPKKG